MKKFLLSILLIIAILFVHSPVALMAEGNTKPYGLDYVYNRAIKFFEDYNILHNIRETVSENDTISRRTALTILCNLEDNEYTQLLQDDNASIKGLLEYPFVDGKKGTADGLLTALAYRYEFLKGYINHEGQLEANLDQEITLKQALLFIERRIRIMKKIEDFPEAEWFNIAQESGIINYSSYYYSDPVQFNMEEGDQPITYFEFLIILYNAVHIPIYVQTSQGTVVTNFKDYM